MPQEKVQPLAGMVDDPGMFGTLAEWESFLAGVEAAPSDDPFRPLLLANARQRIASLKAAKG